jgi:osmotically-inducible protein OsmY
MTISSRAGAWTAAVVLAGFGYMEWGQQRPLQTMQYPQEHSSAAAQGQAAALSDAELQQNVQDRLDADPSLRAAGVSATVNQGKVTLMGIVPDRILKKRAVQLARSIGGVRQVRDLLTVHAGPVAAPGVNAGGIGGQPNGAANEAHGYAPAPSTAQRAPAAGASLQHRLTQALASDPVLGKYPITVTVANNQDVVLQGMVPSERDKRQAQDLAQAMAGARAVKNKLKVNPHAVELGAPSGSRAAANPAGQEAAHPPGDTLPSQSQSGLQSPVAPESSGAKPVAPDAVVRQEEEVNQALQRDPVLRPYRISVIVTRPGKVELLGAVPTHAIRKRAASVAMGVTGVASVNNKIKVRPSARRNPALPPDPPPAGTGGAGSQAKRPVTPQDLRTELQARLQANPKLSGVVVYVSGRHVILRGNVAGQAARKEAGHLVRAALPKGYSVNNHVAINQGMGNGFPPR